MKMVKPGGWRSKLLFFTISEKQRVWIWPLVLFFHLNWYKSLLLLDNATSTAQLTIQTVSVPLAQRAVSHSHQPISGAHLWGRAAPPLALPLRLPTGVTISVSSGCLHCKDTCSLGARLRQLIFTPKNMLSVTADEDFLPHPILGYIAGATRLTSLTIFLSHVACLLLTAGTPCPTLPSLISWSTAS